MSLGDFKTHWGVPFIKCPKCGSISVNRDDDDKLMCWHNTSCCWEETRTETTEEHSVTVTTDNDDSYAYFVKMMGI